MLTRRACLAAAAATPLLATASPTASASSRVEQDAIRETMRRATRFMTDKVSTRGGYVWSYLPDFSRRWGEMEAWPSMIWTQAPGTPEMGQVFLDAWRVTGEDQYLKAAISAADALIHGQHPSGGWNYIIDFEGEASLRRWYETIGKNGWRLEEFQHYYGNATFDDHATIECARFLLRTALITDLPHIGASLDRAIEFVLNSQLSSGGWPQRWPYAGEFNNHGRPDYTGLITLNDEVMDENISFLLLVMQQWKRPDLEPAIRRAMACYRDLQQPSPTPGWALQYNHDFTPAAGRTYEPAAISPHVTAVAIERMLDFYQLTGDPSFLGRLDEALDWIEQVEAPASVHHEGRNHYRYIEPGTQRVLAVHRRGSNAQNGEYYTDFDIRDQRAEKHINLSRLRQDVERVSALSPEQATKDSALFGRGPSLLSDYVLTRQQGGSDLNLTSSRSEMTPVTLLIEGLNKEGYWPVELRTTSHAYRGDGPDTPANGFVDKGQVGDEWDTSPFTQDSGPLGISTGTYINNMARLISRLRQVNAA